MFARFAAMTGQGSALRQTWSVSLYRGATIAMLLSGLGASAAAPQIVLFLVRELDTPLPLAGLYYLTSLAAPVAGFFIGRLSDRTGNRLGLFRLCVFAGFLGWGGIALSSAIWMPFVISTLVLAFSGAAASQIFAAVHDELNRTPDSANESIVAIIRMALTAGWVVGPVIGAWVGAEFGLRALLWLTAVLVLAQIVPMGRLNVDAPAAPGAASPEPRPASRLDFRTLLPLLVFTALFVLVYAGEPIKYGFLLMYMEDSLHLDPVIRGAVIGIQPLVELLIMPFSVLIGRRVGMIRAMALAALLGFAANLCFAFWPSAIGMFAGQILMGGVWGLFMVLGIIVAQRLLPGAVATSSAIFMNAPALASAWLAVWSAEPAWPSSDCPGSSCFRRPSPWPPPSALPRWRALLPCPSPARPGGNPLPHEPRRGRWQNDNVTSQTQQLRF